MAKWQKPALEKVKLKELSEDFQQREVCFLTNTLLNILTEKNLPQIKVLSQVSGSVAFCCIVYFPISVTSRFWMFNISQLKCFCEAFLWNSFQPLPSC